MGRRPGYRIGRCDSPVTLPTRVWVMLALFQATLGAVLAAFRPRASLVIDNLALRQQLAILRRFTSRPRLCPVRSGVLGHALADMVALGADRCATRHRPRWSLTEHTSRRRRPR
jgi:hypothetical protein